MKKYFFISMILVAMASVSCHHNPPRETAFHTDTIPVKVAPIDRQPVASVFQSVGYFTTDDETPLSFKNGGIVENIYVDEGDKVSAGQVLARVKGVESNAAAQQAEIAYQKASRDYERAVNLYHDSVATLESMQNAKTALEIAKQQRVAANYNNGQSVIRAKTNGVVLKRYLNVGQMAGPGMPVLLVNSTAKNSWLFKTGVSDAQWAALRVGDSAIITTDAGSGKAPVEAVVCKKNEGVDPETGSFTIQLKPVNTNGLPLAAGLFGKATLYPTQKAEAWRIPYDAVLDGDMDKAYVFITDDQQHAKKVQVRVSGLDHKEVIVDTGLAGAKYLIISGSAYLNDGSIIKVINNNND